MIYARERHVIITFIIFREAVTWNYNNCILFLASEPYPMIPISKRRLRVKTEMRRNYWHANVALSLILIRWRQSIYDVWSLLYPKYSMILVCTKLEGLVRAYGFLSLIKAGVTCKGVKGTWSHNSNDSISGFSQILCWWHEAR
jgi:hypothetical protein